MAVTVEMHNTGDPGLQRDVVAMVEHVLSDRHGDWRVSIIGTQESDRWEMKIYGPNAFERSYTLEGSADDNAAIRQALCRLFLSEADFEICGEAEKNGQEAIEKAQELRPDLIVMDLSMPVMNGIEAVRVLKRLMPKVPVIIFSEYSDVFSEKEARSAGVSALVSKAEHVSVLLGKARALLYDVAA